MAQAEQVPATVTTYPRKLIGKLSELKLDEPVDFSYPDEGAFSDNMVVKLGVKSGGGIGPRPGRCGLQLCLYPPGQLSGGQL